MPPFDPDKFLNKRKSVEPSGPVESFDPDKFLQKKQTSISEKAETGLRSVVEGATFGVSEPFISTARAGAETLTGLLPKSMQSEGLTKVVAAAPLSTILGLARRTFDREGFDKRFEKDVGERVQLKEALPTISKGGEIVGGLLPVGGPGLLLNVGKTALRSAGKGAIKRGLVKAGVGGLGGAAMTETRKAALETTGFQEPGTEQTGTAVALGAGLPIVGSALGRVGRAAIGKAKPAKNVQKIVEATRKLPGSPEPTGGQITRSDLVKDLESTLRKSPTLGAKGVREKSEAVFKGVKLLADDLTKEGIDDSAFVVGEKVKGGVLSKLKSQFNAVEKSFEKLDSKFADTVVSQKDLAPAIAEAQKMLVHGDKKVVKFAEQALKELDNITLISQLKQYRSALGGSLEATASPNMKSAVKRLYGPLTESRANAILRVGGKSGVEAQKAADKQFREVFKKIRTSTGAKRLRGKEGALGVLEDVPSERVSERFFPKKNIRQLRAMQKNFPEEFDTLRRAEIGKIADKAKGSPRRLMTEMEKLGPENRSIIFGKDSEEKFKTLKTVIESLPEEINPSGTSRRKDLLEMFSPGKQLTSLGLSTILKLKTPTARAAIKASIREGKPTAVAISDFLNSQSTTRAIVTGTRDGESAIERRSIKGN